METVLTRDELKTQLQNLHEATETLKTAKILNTDTFHFYVQSKTLFEIDGKVYRLSQKKKAWDRLMLGFYFEARGCDIFADEELEEDMCFDDIIVTSQNKLRVNTQNDERSIISELEEYCDPDTLRFLLAECGVIGLNCQNTGYDDEIGRLKVFDCIYNTTARIKDDELCLLDKYGRVLYGLQKGLAAHF